MKPAAKNMEENKQTNFKNLLKDKEGITLPEKDPVQIKI